LNLLTIFPQTLLMIPGPFGGLGFFGPFGGFGFFGGLRFSIQSL
jgi:hypothetical protein